MRASVRWWLAALVLVGCSCEDDAESLAAEGYVRCHMAAPAEGTRRIGERTLRFEERTLTIEGMPSAVTLAVAAGPFGDEAPEADLYVLLGDLSEAPTFDPHGAPVLAIAGGADGWDRWRQAVGNTGDTTGLIDATPLRLVRAGPVELVPVPGAPSRYAATDGACGRGGDDAEEWSLETPGAGTTRVLVSWAGGDARGLLGAPAGDPMVRAIRSSAHAGPVVFAWPREDSRAIRPAAGPWIVRGNGHREAPGWTLFEADAEGWRPRPDSP